MEFFFLYEGVWINLFFQPYTYELIKCRHIWAVRKSADTLWACQGVGHLEEEKKVKVVAAVSGTEFIQFLAVLAVLH